MTESTITALEGRAVPPRRTAVAALLDDAGRRTRLRDQLAGSARRQRRAMETKANYVTGKAEGVSARMSGAGRPVPVDDRQIVDYLHEIGSGEFGEALDAVFAQITKMMS